MNDYLKRLYLPLVPLAWERVVLFSLEHQSLFLETLIENWISNVNLTCFSYQEGILIWSGSESNTIGGTIADTVPISGTVT